MAGLPRVSVRVESWNDFLKEWQYGQVVTDGVTLCSPVGNDVAGV